MSASILKAKSQEGNHENAFIRRSGPHHWHLILGIRKLGALTLGQVIGTPR